MANKFIFEVDDMAEGVYMASGDNVEAAHGSGCWTITYNLQQTPREGFPYYVYQIDGDHAANHECYRQQARIQFNTIIKTAETKVADGVTATGMGTNTIILHRDNRKANYTDHVGFGDLKITCDVSPEIISIEMTDENAVGGLFE